MRTSGCVPGRRIRGRKTLFSRIIQTSPVEWIHVT